MAHLKKANAMVVHPRVSRLGWDGIRRVASAAATTRNLVDQARTILGGPLDPDRYLFTHCTIVASVDTEHVAGVKLGKIRRGSTGPIIDRRYADYYIKPECSQFVNNNGDSWSRQVLAAAFPTFIGSHNFQEHVQVEAKSKGRILDAVSRDIGDSLYVDILVATDRKHAVLINDIKSGKMGTLSMGCTTDFTVCSQCGHFAIDETDLCEHIRHAKLNTFLDDQNQKRVIAELCGHIKYTDNPEAPGGVRFIEASWVGVPAFPGAVMRNILSTGETNIPESQLRRLLATAPSSWSDHAISKAASFQVRSFEEEEENAQEEEPAGEEQDDQGVGQDDQGGQEEQKEAPAPAAEPPAEPFKDLEDQVYDDIKSRVKDRIDREIRENNVDLVSDSVMEPNDNLLKEAKKKASVGRTATQKRYAASVDALVRAASSDAALVDGLARVNRSFGLKVSVACYRAALRAGPLTKYASPKSYMLHCKKFAGRSFTPAEFRVVVRLGSLLSRWDSINTQTAIRSS